MEYTEHQQSLLRKLEQLQKDEGLSLSALSARLGISKGALSQLFSGSYQANPQKMFAKLESYFGVKDQTRQTYQESGYADTSISTEIYDIIGVCQIKGGLAIAAGDAGIGKTKAAQHFVAEHPNNSVLITLNPCLTSIKSLLRLIADRIGAPMERSRDALWYSIRQKLSDGTVLIFDESQHLPLKTIEVLRSFSDDFADHGQTLGICFIGNLETVTRIGSKKAEFAQIANQREDIAKLFPMLNGRQKEIDFLFRIAQTPQAIRGVVNLFSNAYDNEDYSYEGLVAMAKYMEMEV